MHLLQYINMFLPHTSHPYNKTGAMQLSNNFNIMSVSRFNHLPFCISEHIAFDALSCSSFLALTNDPFHCIVLLTLGVIGHASVTIFVFGTLYYKCAIRLSA